jgi:hypothetical protein
MSIECGKQVMLAFAKLNSFMENGFMEGQKVTLDDNERTVCEIWTRVMGYYRPTAAFNDGKKSECKERKCFTEDKLCEKKDDCCQDKAA